MDQAEAGAIRCRTVVTFSKITATQSAPVTVVAVDAPTTCRCNLERCTSGFVVGNKTTNQA